MKTLLTSLVLVLLCTLSLSAQQPQDTIPQLKEWWRTDVLQYGKYGMTWLDNFYHGKGALVVYTSEGVKTWLLRFPGDTMNVFSWEKGSSNIKTGDFNGDGITDYVDENSNIYEGIKNGEPPKSRATPQVITVDESNSPNLIQDLNNDGNDDIAIFTLNTYKTPGVMKIIFGNKIVDSMRIDRFPLSGLDSNNQPIVAYTLSKNEMRVICTHTYWTNNKNYPFQTIYKDGLRLLRVWWDGTTFKSSILDEFTYNTQNGNGWFYGGKLFLQSPSEIYWLCQHGEGVITVYNLYKDKFDSYSTVTNAIGLLGSLTQSIDDDTIPDFYAIQQIPEGDHITIYSGEVSKGIHPLCEFTTVQIAAVASMGDVTGDGKADIALSNLYSVSGRQKYRFSILTTKDSTSSVDAEPVNTSTFSINTISPMPVSKDKTVQIKVSVPQEGSYTACFYDNTGKKIPGKSENYQLSGEQIITLNIGDYALSSGTYTVRLEGNGRIAQCTILVR